MAANKKFVLPIVIQSVDRATAGINSVMSKIRRGSSRLASSTGLNKIGAQTLLLGGRLGNVGSQVLGLGRKLGLTALVGVAAAASLVTSYARAGDEIAKTAFKIGLSVESLQEWRFAAERSGIETRTLDTAMARFTKVMGEAAEGTGEGLFAVQRLGINVHNASGELRSMDDLLMETGKSLSTVENEVERNAIAMDLFGQRGLAMIQLLGKGPEELENLRAKARELGLIMSADAAKGAEDYQDALTNLQGAAAGVRNIFGSSLLPILTQGIAKLTELVVAKRPEIVKFATSFAERLPETLSDLREQFRSLLSTIQPVLDIGGWLIERYGAVKVTAGILAVALGGPLLAGLIGVTTAAWGLTAALLANPMVWVIGLVAFLTVKFVGLLKNLHAGGARLSDTWQLLKIGVGHVVEFMLSSIRKLESVLPEWLLDFLKGNPVTGAVFKVANDNPAGSIVNPLIEQLQETQQARVDEANSQAAAQAGERKLVVDLRSDLPEGITASLGAGSDPDIDSNLGFAFGGA